MASHPSFVAVESDPLSWEAWTGVPKTTNVGVLGEADKSGDIAVVRVAYERFLAIYPLCFGYWKKFAEHEWKAAAGGDAASTTAVYERSVLAAPHEWNCWVNYAAFAAANIPDVAAVRSVFQRAVAVCGSDPKAAALWSAYVDFEARHAGSDGSPVRVLSRQVGCGTPLAEPALARLRELAHSRHAHELVLPGEEAAVEAEVQAALAGGRGEREDVTREVALARRAADASASAALASARAVHEAALGKRYWFHVMPIAATALAGWRSYLDFEESAALEVTSSPSASPLAIAAAWARVEKLYGRCLIPCAGYAEFWIRYAAFRREYPEAYKSSGPACGLPGPPSAILLTAHTHFCPGRVDILVATADALEEEGAGEAALRVFERSREGSACALLESPHPLPVPGWAASSAEVTVRHGQAIMRLGAPAGGIARASTVLRAAIDGASSPAVLAPYYAELARSFAVCGDGNRAGLTWAEGGERCGSSLAYWQAWAGAAAAHGLEGGAAGVYARSLGLDEDGRPRGGRGGGGAGASLTREEDTATAWALYLEALRTALGGATGKLVVAGDEHARWVRTLAGGAAAAGTHVSVGGRKRALDPSGSADTRPAKSAHTTA